METKKGFQMSVSVMIAIVLSLLFIATFWAAFSGYFDTASQSALNLVS